MKKLKEIKREFKIVINSIKRLKGLHKALAIILLIPILLLSFIINMLLCLFNIIRKNIEIFLLIALVVLSAILLSHEINGRLEVGEKAECNKWLRYSVEYSDFYLTEWQKEQCDTVGVEINVPVITNN